MNPISLGAIRERVKEAMTAVERYHAAHADHAIGAWSDHTEAAHRLRKRGLHKAAGAAETKARQHKSRYVNNSAKAGKNYTAKSSTHDPEKVSRIEKEHEHLG